MKRLILPMTLLFVLAVCVSAQQTAPANKKAADKASAQLMKKLEAANRKAQEAKNPVCAYCGEEIVSNGQHCSAADYNGLCTAVKQKPAKSQAASDGYLGGDPHNPDNYIKKDVSPKAVNKDVSSDPQGRWNGIGDPHNPANWTVEPAQVKEYVNDSGYLGGDPHNPDNYVKKDVSPKAVNKDVSSDPQGRWNGIGDPHNPANWTVEPAQVKEYVNDSGYLGGDPHNSDNYVKKEVKADKVPVCAYCGEEIISNGQHCTSADNNGLCSTIKSVPAKAQVQDNGYLGGDPHNPANYAKRDSLNCPDCGRTPSQVKVSGHNHKLANK